MKVEYGRKATAVDLSLIIPSRLADKVPKIMEDSKIRPVGIGGGTGWSLDCHQGTLQITLPLHRAREVGDILFRLSQLHPEFQNGLELKKMVREVL